MHSDTSYPPENVVRYFVDEAGDPTLFSRKGRILVGSEGCSAYFIMGKLEVTDENALAADLGELRKQLLADPYFKGVPSMQPVAGKTALAFHANNDLAEVRREVYQVLLRHELRFYAVVRDKRELLAHVQQRNEQEPQYRYQENALYDVLVSELFSRYRGVQDRVEICFSKRGKRDRTAALRRALEDAECTLQETFGVSRQAPVEITASTPKQTPGLQAADYYLWALQRFYERGEDRFVELDWPQVGEIHDLDLIEKRRRGVLFHESKMLNRQNRPL